MSNRDGHPPAVVIDNNSRAINDEMPIKKRILKRLMNVIYYTSYGSDGVVILRKMLKSILSHTSLAYNDVLDRGAFVFPQHAGAAMLDACFLLALGRVVDPNSSMKESRRRYFQRLLEPVQRLFMASGGRPNINTHVLFHEGNNNPAFGFYHPPHDTVPAAPQMDHSVGPPKVKHHVIMHGPDDILYPRVLIHAKAYPPKSATTTSLVKLDTDEAPLRSHYEHDPLVLVAEMMADLVDNSSPDPPISLDLIDHVHDFVLEYHVNVYYQHFDDVKLLERYLREDPLPFLLYCVLKGSAI